MYFKTSNNKWLKAALCVRSCTLSLSLCLACLGSSLNVKRKVWVFLFFSFLEAFFKDLMLDYNRIYLSSCSFSISDWVLYSEPVPQRKNTFPPLSLLLLSSLILFFYMELIVPRAAKKGFSALHRWGLHVARNMKWALEEQVVMLQVGIVLILSAPAAF